MSFNVCRSPEKAQPRRTALFLWAASHPHIQDTWQRIPAIPFQMAGAASGSADSPRLSIYEMVFGHAVTLLEHGD
ncbi:hypothetical protein [Pandoraea terrigena]|uniref:hypothetical protein n=1 Tax=Pandoraea terrigena TaxID=2508292 RepID=UPI0012430FDF|nr:hypothetical protein [Pandoraea terrigena]